VGGNVEMQNAAQVMGQHQKHVKNLDTDRGHSKEIDGDQLLRMILQKCAPRLRGRFVSTDHVFADGALSEVDADFEEFALDAGCTTQVGFSRHIPRIRSRVSRVIAGRPGVRAPVVRKKSSPSKSASILVQSGALFRP
jgi:hypothetical protein